MDIKNNDLSENLEDYLETIMALEKKNKVARVKDIASELGILRGSVTGALKTLAKKGLVNYEPYSFISLTKKGTSIAKEISRRHGILKNFLEKILQIAPDKAEQNACRMEHAVDRETIDMLVKFINFVDDCPRAGSDWIQAFIDFCSTGKPDEERCSACMETKMKETAVIEK